MNALPAKLLLVLLAATAAPALFAEPLKVAPVAPAPARSVFVMPANPRDGRDPFFPDSVRPFEEAAPTQHVLDVTSFSVKGISVEHGRTMVIINNHTFALGDEGDVLTTSGRVHIRLADIRANSVFIDVNGSRRELTIGIK